MAQGGGKLGKVGARKKSAGSQRRKGTKAAKKQNKGSSKVESKDKGIVAATKMINRKNERIIAAKATNAHTKFYLSDLTVKGKCRDGSTETTSFASTNARGQPIREVSQNASHIFCSFLFQVKMKANDKYHSVTRNRGNQPSYRSG